VNRAIEYGRQNRGEGTRTREQAEQSERRRQLADQIRSGNKVDLAGEIKAGRITRRDAQLVSASREGIEASSCFQESSDRAIVESF